MLLEDNILFLYEAETIIIEFIVEFLISTGKIGDFPLIIKV